MNVQLIRAATDEHVWAESYNRKLDDVFAVEGEVASAIAEQLSLKLSGTEQKAVTAKPTENAAAYDAYLRGLSIEHTSYGYDTYQRAARSYAKAVELDPNFALAWARLSILRSFLYFNMVDLERTPPTQLRRRRIMPSHLRRTSAKPTWHREVIVIASFAISKLRSHLIRRRSSFCRIALWSMNISRLSCGGLAGGKKQSPTIAKRLNSTPWTCNCSALRRRVLLSPAV